MTATTPSTALATVQPVFTDSERLALAGFLAGYRGLTREAYTLDLRQFTAWCRLRSLSLFSVRRADIETFARELEARGRARATVTRRLCTIAGFYRYAVEEELLEHSPAAHARRPRLDYESHAARWSPSRWRRARRGRSTWLSASARTARSSWLRTGGGWTGTAPGGSSARRLAAPGSRRPSRPTRCGTRSSPQFAGVPLRDVQEAASHADPRTTIRYDRARGSLDRHATYIVAAYIAGATR